MWLFCDYFWPFKSPKMLMTSVMLHFKIKDTRLNSELIDPDQNELMEPHLEDRLIILSFTKMWFIYSWCRLRLRPHDHRARPITDHQNYRLPSITVNLPRSIDGCTFLYPPSSLFNVPFCISIDLSFLFGFFFSVDYLLLLFISKSWTISGRSIAA